MPQALHQQVRNSQRKQIIINNVFNYTVSLPSLSLSLLLFLSILLSSLPPSDPSKPLLGFKIATAGRLAKTKVQLKELILSLGGEMSSSVTRNTTLLISDENELESTSTAVSEAEKQQIPVVDIGFLDDVANGDALGKVKPHTISSWTASPRLRSSSSGREDETDFGSSAFEKGSECVCTCNVVVAMNNVLLSFCC